MIFNALIIFAAATIFIVLARRLPDTGDKVVTKRLDKINSSNHTPEQPNTVSGFWEDHQLPKVKFKIKVPKLPQLPKIKWRLKDKKPPTLEPILPISLDELIIQADRLMTAGDLKGAEENYLKAAARMPNNPKLYNRLGIIYLQQKNFADARDAFLAGLKYDDRIAGRHYNLAQAYLGLGREEKAKVALKKALELDPNNAKYTKTLASLEKKA